MDGLIPGSTINRVLGIGVWSEENVWHTGIELFSVAASQMWM